MQPTSTIVRVALVATLLVLAISGIISYYAIERARAADAAVTATTDVQLTLERALSVVRDAETGQRGFLLTADPVYLEPYQRALDELVGRLNQLRISLADQAESFAQLRQLIDAKTAELAQSIELERTGNHSAALTLVRSNLGKGYMDQIRGAIARLQVVQSQRLAQEERDQIEARRLTNAGIVADRVLALALMVLLVVVVRNESKRVRLSEQWLAITLRSIGDAVIATDEAGGVRMLNTVAEQLTGWSSRQAAGEPLERVFRIVNEETRQTVESPVIKALREGRIVGLANHTLLIGRDGVETPIEDSAAPISDSTGRIVGVVLVFRDASVERSNERELREADRAKDEFIAVLAHELRNPLAPILQASRVARLPGVDERQLRLSYEIIERQAQTMARLLDDLLDVSRITRGTLEIRKSRVTLTSVIDSAVETTQPAIAAQRHRLVLDLPRERVELDADPIRLAQVIANLLKNAAKYTDPDGEIRLSAERHGQQLTISVRDNGIGLAPEALPRVFDMFVQVKDSLQRHEGGLGIGLALARRLIDLHGGTIEARSAGVGLGSEFIVHIPCVESSGSDATNGASPALTQKPAGRRLRILVADDNRDAAESLAMLLQMDGHEVHVANDGAEALSLFERAQPEVALLDIGMPGLNGYQLAERIRARPPRIPPVLVALTGWGQAQDLERARAAGFDHHLVKPADPSDIHAILRSL